MRSWIAIALIILVAIVVANLGAGFLWALAAVGAIGTVALMILSARSGGFAGPQTLVDDARERLERTGRPASGEDYVVVELPKDDRTS